MPQTSMRWAMRIGAEIEAPPSKLRLSSIRSYQFQYATYSSPFGPVFGRKPAPPPSDEGGDHVSPMSADTRSPWLNAM